MIFLLPLISHGQPDSLQNKPIVDFSVFADAFFAYDFNRPSRDVRQPFYYNHNRHNQVNANMLMVKAGVSLSKFHANLALHAGTYSKDNYAHEPGILKHLYEANAGVALNRKNDLWLEAGIFNSHIGFENVVSVENPTLTRSLVAETVPYYLSGLRLDYNPSDRWDLSILICNGWQRIKPVSGNSLPGFGTQVYYNFKKVELNWSTFVGTDDPDDTRRMRYFNNVYGRFLLSEKVNLTAGIDFGMQQTDKGARSVNTWMGITAIVQVKMNSRWAAAARAEYYRDKKGILVLPPSSFIVTGYSLNIDYTITPAVTFRVEARNLSSPYHLFQGEKTSNNSPFVIGSLAFRLY